MTPVIAITLAGVAAGLGLGYCYYRGTGVRRKGGEGKEDLTPWEGEGGNVPTVATPTPQAKPESSIPPGVAQSRP